MNRNIFIPCMNHYQNFLFYEGQCCWEELEDPDLNLQTSLWHSKKVWEKKRLIIDYKKLNDCLQDIDILFPK